MKRFIRYWKRYSSLLEYCIVPACDWCVRWSGTVQYWTPSLLHNRLIEAHDNFTSLSAVRSTVLVLVRTTLRFCTISSVALATPQVWLRAAEVRTVSELKILYFFYIFCYTYFWPVTVFSYNLCYRVWRNRLNNKYCQIMKMHFLGYHVIFVCAEEKPKNFRTFLLFALFSYSFTWR